MAVTRRLLVGLALILVLSPPGLSLAGAVRWDSGRLWLSAETEPLGIVLAEVARAAGLTVAGAVDLRDTVSIQLDGVPLAEALERLLRGRSYLLISDPAAPTVPPKLVLLGDRNPSGPEGRAILTGDPATVDQDRPAALTGDDATAPPASAFASLDTASPEELAAALAEPGAGDVAEAAFERLAAQDPQDAARVVRRLAGNPDGALRRRALELLDRAEAAEPGEALAAIIEAASDPDEEVRIFALSALALRRGGDSEAVLRRELQNPDPDVRIAVIQSIAERDPTSELVREASADGDPRVAGYARALMDETGLPEEP
jgi:hypothetical protein